MPVPEITLRGTALAGVDAQHLPQGLMAQLPQKVKLGRKRPKAHPPVLRLSAFFAPARMATPPPKSTNWRAKAGPALARMYLNDTYGCCVIAGKAHALGLWSGNDVDSGGIVEATDREIYDQYQGICGPGDNGCVITDVLDVMRAKGFQAGGKLYKIDGYVSADWTDKLEAQVVLAIFGAATIGINLPQAWTENDVWDVTESPIVGGHDVTPIDYDEQGVYVSSWGRVYLITWRAFQSKRWVEEMYAVLGQLWYGNDKLAPSGIDAAALAADLAKLQSGILPDVGPTPQPPAPPIPPTPPPVPPPGRLFTLTFAHAVPKGGRVSGFRAPVNIPAGSYAVVPLGKQTAEPDEFGVEAAP